MIVILSRKLQKKDEERAPNTEIGRLYASEK